MTTQQTSGPRALVGRRVQLHPATDAWTAGDRFGEITRATAGKAGTFFFVKMDRSGRVRRIAGRNVEVID